VTRGLLVLTAGTVGLWLVLAAGAAGLLGPGHWLPSGAAAGLCLVPSAGTFVLSRLLERRSPEEAAVAVLLGVVVRLGTALLGGLLLCRVVPELAAAPLRFWSWVLVFYLATLAAETFLLLPRSAGARTDPPNPLGR
jgi:hypothetical protein